MLTTAGLNLGTLTVRSVNNIVIALDATISLVLRLPVRTAREGSLEGTVGPVCGLIGLVTGGAL
jgi:hypothetical protein